MTTGTEPRHSTAVEKTFALADAAAARGQYLVALGWLQTLEAFGDSLEQMWTVSRAAWEMQMEGDRNEPSRWFG